MYAFQSPKVMLMSKFQSIISSSFFVSFFILNISSHYTISRKLFSFQRKVLHILILGNSEEVGGVHTEKYVQDFEYLQDEPFQSRNLISMRIEDTFLFPKITYTWKNIFYLRFSFSCSQINFKNEL